MTMTQPVTQKGMLRGIDYGGSMTFQFNPEQIEEGENSRWANISIVGMHNPRVQYMTGDGHTISFTLKMYHTDGGMTPKKRIDWLRSLVYPDTGAGLPGRPPTRVALVLGPDFNGVPCIVISVKATSSMWDSALNVTYAEATVELLEVATKAISYSEVR